MSVVDKHNLLNYNQAGLIALFKEWGEPAYRAQQIIKWVHKQGVTDFDAMTDLSKNVRQQLKEKATITAPTVAMEKKSADGTVKWLFRLSDGNLIETVYIPEPKRGTLCISSQVGCMLNCTFCSTATQGFNRNLQLAEIIGQVWMARSRLNELDAGKITNIVFMGMGEPLLNIENVFPALELLRHPHAYELPRRRVTISTSGVVPNMDKLSEEMDVALAISLHAPTDELRNQLVPLNKKYRLSELLASCKRYLDGQKNRLITMEYVMIDGVNDTPAMAKALLKILNGLRVKVNLIPFNPFPGTKFKRSQAEAIHSFQQYLNKRGLVTTVRRTRGDDIDAACGQLVGQVKDRTKRQIRFRQRIEGDELSGAMA